LSLATGFVQAFWLARAFARNLRLTPAEDASVALPLYSNSVISAKDCLEKQNILIKKPPKF